MKGRPKIKNKKKNLSLSINSELDEMLDKFVKEQGITKSEYLEYLIRKNIEK